MCLAPPAQVLEVRPGQADVARGEARFTVATFLLDEPLVPGDWVAVQAQRHAIQRLDETEATELRRLYEEIIGMLENPAAAE